MPRWNVAMGHFRWTLRGDTVDDVVAELDEICERDPHLKRANAIFSPLDIDGEPTGEEYIR